MEDDLWHPFNCDYVLSTTELAPRYFSSVYKPASEQIMLLYLIQTELSSINYLMNSSL